MLARLDRTHALCAKVSPHGRARSASVAMRTHELATRGARSVAITSMVVPLRQTGMRLIDVFAFSGTYN
jgi:hypothetical protein